jgi:multiple sugar transport system permease protein
VTKVEPSTGRVGSPPHRRRFTRKRWRGAGFLLPFLIPFALFYIAPIAYAVWESLFRLVRPEGIFGKPQLVFAGLSQYGDVLANPDFRDGIGRVLIFAAIQIPVVIVLAVTLVLALDSSRARFPRFFRLAYFVPYAVPTVVSTILWGSLYSPDLSPLGAVGLHVSFLNAQLVIFAIANIGIWTYCGYNVVVLHSALQSIPLEIYEAARIDGAGEFAIAWRIKLPLLRNALILIAVFSIIGTLQLFTEPQIMRSISTAITTTYTPSMLAYSVASNNQYNAAAAISVSLAAATFVLSFGFLKLAQGRGCQSL